MSGFRERNPFVGPRPFRVGEKLYGRETEQQELFHLLKARRIVMLHSPSGAGKSSLVNAALIPMLRQERFDVWHTVRLNTLFADMDGNRFIHSTIASLEDGIPERHRQGRDLSELAQLRLVDYLEERPRRPNAPDNVVLIFDQFEEILTTDASDVDAKTAFFDQLGEALNQSCYWALFIIREDHLAALAPYRDAIPTKLSNTFRIDLLERDAARNAIVQPAESAGRKFPAAETLIQELAKILVEQPDRTMKEELGRYVEPVQLQVVCNKLWNDLPDDDDSIDHEDLKAFGSVDEALATHYKKGVQRTAAGDPLVERKVREWFGHRLIVAGIRSTVRGDDVGVLSEEQIQELLKAHLIRSERRTGVTWYELAHDRLIGPVLEDNEAWLAGSLSEWQKRAALWKQNRSERLLLVDEELSDAQVEASQKELVDEMDGLFLEASAKLQVERDRQRRQEKMIRGLALVAVFVAVAAVIVSLIARRERAKAIQLGRSASVGSLLASGQGVRGNLVALEVEVSEKMPPTLEALHQALGSRLERVILEGHEKDVIVAVFSPDDRRVLTASDDNSARIWDAKTGQTLHTLHGHRSPVTYASWSIDGKKVLTASRDTTARLWDSDSGQTLAIFKGHGRSITHASWSTDNKQVLTASGDRTARLWSVESGQALQVLRGHTGSVVHTSWSADGKQVLTGSEDHTARIWNAGNGQPLLTLRGHEGRVLHVSWSVDGNRVLTASTDTTARIWSTENGETLHILQGHNHSIVYASWSADGKRILTASGDKTARIWSGENGRILHILQGHNNWVFHASWSADGKQVLTASADTTARVWSAETGRTLSILPGHTDWVYHASWNVGGGRVLTASRDRTARVWNSESGQILHTLQGHTDAVVDASWNIDGKRVLTASWDNTSRIWDGESGQILHTLRGHLDKVYHASWSLDGQRILTASADSTARIWSSDSGQTLHSLSGHQAHVYHASWSLDSQRVLTASADRTARVWNSESGEALHSLRGHQGRVYHASWSKDGQRILTASEDRTARVWNGETGQILHVLQGHQANVVHASWSSDSKRVFTASWDTTARIWNGETGQLLQVLRGHEDRVVHVSGSVDGERVLTSSFDNSARIWSAESGEVLHVLRGHQENVVHASWSADGSRVLTASRDNTARIWSTETGQILHTMQGHEDRVVHASWSVDGKRVLTASVDKTVRIWAANGEEHLKGRIRASTQECLSVNDRQRYLIESPDNAQHRFDACERCVPSFHERLEGVPRGAVEPYEEAWRWYEGCLAY